MKVNERKAIREALLSQGFGHADIGHDGDGDGAYTEVWVRTDTNGRTNTVTLDWAPREKD